MKKIKKDTVVPAKVDPKDLIQYLKLDEIAEEIERKKAAKKVVKRPGVKTEVPIEHWTWKEFLKFYLSEYEKVIGFKDSNYIELSLKDAFKEKNRLDRLLKLYFNNNKQEFKDYISWAIRWWMSDANDFLDGTPRFWTMFSDKGTITKKYFDRNFNQNQTKKKIVKKPASRKDWDNHFASKEAWDVYLDGE